MALDLIFVKNTGHRPIYLRHSRLGNVTIVPGQQRAVAWEQACAAFGNPSIVNHGTGRDRSEEYNRLLTFYGVYPGVNPEDKVDLLPQYEAHRMDSNGDPGERVTFVLDDPDGTGTPARAPLNLDNEDAVRDTLESMRLQIAHLEKVVEASDRAKAKADTDATAIAVPEVTKATANRRRTASGEDAPATVAHDPEGEDQATRNEVRDELPKPARRTVRADSPRGNR